MHAQSYDKTIRFFLRECPHLPILAYGLSGIGKSEVPVAVANSLTVVNGEIQDRSTDEKEREKQAPLPLIYADCTGMEPTDLLGLPDKDNSEYTRYKPPKFLELAVTEPHGILILDEVTRLDMQVRHTLMQLLARREIGEVKLNPGWLIVMTANPADEGFQVQELDVAYRRRSVIIPISFNMDVWRDWAMNNGIHPRVFATSGRVMGGLHKGIDRKIENTLTPAGLKAASDLMKAGIVDELAGDETLEILTGTVGPEAAKALMSSINDELLQRFLALAMEGKPLGQIEYDHQIALVCAFWEKVQKRAKAHAPQIKNLYDQLALDIRILLLKFCHADLLKYPDEFKELIDEWSDWCTKQAKAQVARTKKKP